MADEPQGTPEQGGDPQQQQQQQQAPESQQAQAPAGWEQMLEQKFSEMAERFQPQQAQQQGQGDDPWADPNADPNEAAQQDDLSWMDDPAVMADPELARSQLDKTLNARVESKLQEALGPVFQRFREDDIAGLEDQYPELQQQEVAQQTVQASRQLAQQMGLPPEAGDSPQLIETAYLAQRARERAAQETPAQQQTGVSLEYGAAGAATPQTDAPTLAERILATKGTSTPSVFT